MADIIATYADLVEEAFIQPLRSVLIVDDQYPTWEEILNEALPADKQARHLAVRSREKEWRRNPSGPLDVIKQFRSHKPGFVIDIHDAVSGETHKSDEDELADYLHQSDLLVLDYNLEGAESGLGGLKAREILKSVLTNKHFNLIVVHTSEHDLNEVFSDCLLSLMQSCASRFDGDIDAGISKLEEKLDELVDEGLFDRKVLFEKMTMDDYLSLRRAHVSLGDAIRSFMKAEGYLADVSAWAKQAGLAGKDLKDFFYWAVQEFEKPHKKLFSEGEFEGVSWSRDPERLWFRTVRGFVAFVSKGPTDLLSELQKALEAWQPTPSRLLSAKYRHELSSIGVEAEDRTLLKRHVFAHFYKDFCSKGNPKLSDAEAERLRTAKLKSHVYSKSEAISFHIEDEVARFGERIRLADGGESGDFARFYNLDLSDEKSAESKKARAHYNSYVSTLPLKKGDDQLDSGHIFKWGGDWWVCATPACDLQPGQNTTGFVGESSEQRPFTALKLVEVKNMDDVDDQHVNSGLFCFVEPVDQLGVVICLGFQKIEKSEIVPNGKATWRTFVAEKNGLISQNKMSMIVPKFVDQKLVLEAAEAEVVAKLRYEYALNYIQKIGISVTRIGLGYS
ncbi:hypothetical protein J4E05_15025 [Thalassospira sp. NFXS8]|uniref:response regulator receiver domain n=1 Tax=Thalassospira sp. NFXS8 TaxID=2819093 RepID=UPI0032DF5B03